MSRINLCVTRMRARYVFTIVIALGVFSGLLSAQENNPAGVTSRAERIFASMPRVHGISQTEISPDGSHVAWISGGAIYVIALSQAGTEPVAPPVRIPGDLPVRDLAWAPDSRRIAFIADLEQQVPAGQLWLMDTPSSTPRKIADFKGYISDPRFSRDGNSLAILFIEGIPRIAGPLMPMTPPEGVIAEHHYEQRITTVDLTSGEIHQVSPDNVYVYEYDWMPDGTSWAAIAAHGSGDNNWWIARLYNISTTTGNMRELYKPTLQIAVPRVSADGKQIAFIEGLMSDQGATGGDIFVIPSNGGKARNLTSNMRASASGLNWTGPGRISFPENLDGNAGIATVSTQGGDVKTVWSDFEQISSDGWGLEASFSRDGGSVAVVRQSFSMPPEVWAGPVGQWKQITALNAGVKPAWGEVRNVHWNNEGMRIQGWLLFPKNYDKNKKYPLVVTVHGGPSSACMPRWSPMDGAYSAMGYFELCPNPRGSYGQGEAFTRANVKDFGGGDFRDIMAGIDSLANEYGIDLNRLGIRGHSYGGYMTMWAETQTTRFKAAVAGAGLSDWLSYYGENDIDEWMIPFFGASVYDDPAVYAKSSPINFVKKVQTPTLILVGDRDGEVPAPQSFEWWHALKTLKVPVEFVVYPNEGHSIVQPAHFRDYNVRSLKWFERWFGEVQQGQ
jgi:dipeptidyl aminopeptidase/acylaminoacyl peptidase